MQIRRFFFYLNIHLSLSFIRLFLMTLPKKKTILTHKVISKRKEKKKQARKIAEAIALSCAWKAFAAAIWLFQFFVAFALDCAVEKRVAEIRAIASINNAIRAIESE